MNKTIDPKIFANNIIRGERKSLSKALTLIESSLPDDKLLAEKLIDCIHHLNTKNRSTKIGVSGITGSGKSSLIDELGKKYISEGHQVAVLAIDPSSPMSGGSILGDKTRMTFLGNNRQSYIRPSPTKKFLGGVTKTTRESIFLCEAAGYDIIFVETVGVGQSEIQVKSMVDLFLLVLLPATGDEIQGIKKGINEVADLILINKTDGELKSLAENTKIDYVNALGDHENIINTSSKDKLLIDALFEKIKKFPLRKSDYDDAQRLLWLNDIIEDKIKSLVDTQKQKSFYKKITQQFINREFSGPIAAQKFIDEIFREK